MVERTVGHLLVDYRRNYPVQKYSGIDADKAREAGQPPYDVITIMSFADRADFEKMEAIVMDPAVKAEVEAAQLRLFDRPLMQQVVCETCVSDLSHINIL